MLTFLDAWERRLAQRIRKVFQASGVAYWAHRLTSQTILPERIFRWPVIRLRRLSLYWVLMLLVGLAAGGSATGFLWGQPEAFPVGDAYVHFTYARNLALLGEFTFNPGVSEGIGTSSLLWVLVLAAFQWGGVAPLLAARISGVFLLVLSGFLAFDLLAAVLPVGRDGPRLLVAFLGALLVVLPGNFVWMALSGMETMLFVALALLALNLYVRERWVALGVTIGLLGLTRTEGAALGGVILLVEWLRRRRVGSWTWRLVVPILLIVLPWLLFLQFREGVPVQTSFFGKQVVYAEARKVVGEWNPLVAWLLEFPPLLYTLSWMGYAFLYMTGSVMLPGFRIRVTGPLAREQYSFPVVAFSVVVLGLLFFGTLVVRSLWKRRAAFRWQRPAHRLLAVALIWTLIHNLLYAFLLGIPGSAGRYAPMNHLLLWWTLLAGVLLLRRNWARALALVFTFGLVAVSLAYWGQVYRANLKYMSTVHIPAARYIDQNLPPQALIGATDLGPLRYYARQPIADMFGFVNKELLAYRAAGKNYSQYLRDKDIQFLLASVSFNRDGDQIASFAKQMGVYEDPNLRLVEVASFEVPFDEWLFGSAPVSNYLPAMVILRVEVAE